MGPKSPEGSLSTRVDAAGGGNGIEVLVTGKSSARNSLSSGSSSSYGSSAFNGNHWVSFAEGKPFGGAAKQAGSVFPPNQASDTPNFMDVNEINLNAAQAGNRPFRNQAPQDPQPKTKTAAPPLKDSIKVMQQSGESRKLLNRKEKTSNPVLKQRHEKNPNVEDVKKVDMDESDEFTASNDVETYSHDELGQNANGQQFWKPETQAGHSLEVGVDESGRNAIGNHKPIKRPAESQSTVATKPADNRSSRNQTLVRQLDHQRRKYPKADDFRYLDENGDNPNAVVVVEDPSPVKFLSLKRFMATTSMLRPIRLRRRAWKPNNQLGNLLSRVRMLLIYWTK
jgi:hypothetical protein